MRALKAILAVMIVMLVMVSFGCSKKKDNPTAPPATDNSQHQTQAAGLATTITNPQTGLFSTISDFSSGFGSFVPGSKGAKIPPDTMWHGPQSHSNHYVTPATGGWYSLSDTGLIGGTMTFWVKFTNDIWANPTATVTRVDYQLLSSILAGNTTTAYDYSLYCTYGGSGGTDTSKFTGGEYVGITAGTQTFIWEFTWTNITRHGWDVTPHTCSGTFAFSGTGGYSGNFVFTSGSGTGTLTYGANTVATYTFNANGTGSYAITGTSITGNFNW